MDLCPPTTTGRDLAMAGPHGLNDFLLLGSVKNGGITEGLEVSSGVIADMEHVARGKIGIEEGIQNTQKKVMQYKSAAFAAIHETVDALHQIEAVDESTMQDFDAACLKYPHR